jgi:hypothetical protein
MSESSTKTVEKLDVAAINNLVSFAESTLKLLCWGIGGQLSLMEGDVVHRDDSLSHLAEVLREGLGEVGEGLQAVANAIEQHTKE